ncbi:MAG: tripartite tricarboxylate transporter substrate binding protein [Betaproteobacteria bacterium]|nr:tripartite tricarboxylate transporter substrate binding protein [Betaproteobacteria bacterium]
MAMKKQLARLLFSFVVSFFAVASSPAAYAAQPYPNKPLRFIVPFPPGGGTDILARLVGEGLGERLGFQAVVDNRPGAGTNIGMEIAARAVPDGHTLLMASVGLAANPSLYRKMAFDPLRDLAPVTLVASAPTILVSHPAVAAKTPQELIRLLKSQPGRLNYGSFGSGSGGHLAAELFKLTTGTDVVHVPYKGGGPAITALLGGEVQLVFSSLLPTLPHIKAGRIVPIGLAASRRAHMLPNVTTFREAGVNYETGTWFGVLVPTGTPVPIIGRLHKEITAILEAGEVRARVSTQGAELVGNSPAQFAEFIAAEAKRWSEVVKKADIRVE